MRKVTLRIYTDIENRNWLNYILGEFKRISSANFDIEISEVEAKPSEEEHAVFYCSEIVEGEINLPNKSDVKPNSRVEYLTENLFVFEGTSVSDPKYAVEYDLLWNAFLILSRVEEFTSGNKIQSYCGKHPREDKSTFRLPVVNYYFERLELLIVKFFPALSFGNGSHPRFELSHDVDYIQKTAALRIKQTAFNGFNLVRALRNPSGLLGQIEKTTRFLISSPDYFCFDFWAELEKSLNRRSVFFVYSKIDRKNFKTKLLDPQYDVAADKRLKQKLRDLLDDGFEIGLHGSFFSAEDKELLASEKSKLEDSIGREVKKVRQHWLRYDEQKTPYYHDEFFEVDSTLGWNDTIGFRSGIASVFKPYDHRNDRPFGYFVVPQVIMDSNIFDYSFPNRSSAAKESFELIERVKKIKNAQVSISWHQRVCSVDYGWHKLYERILNEHL